MHNGFLQIVSIRPEASTEWAIILAMLAGLSILALVTAELGWPLRLVLGLLVSLRLGLELYRRVLSSGADHVLYVDRLASGGWRLQTVAGPVSARLLRVWGGQSGPLMVFEWTGTEDRGRWQAWLWRHRCPPAAWRRLRVHMRLTQVK